MTREEIIQNIKARISTIESYHPEEYALNQGNLFELKDLLSMIEKDEPSLPSNLDEAAEKMYPKQYAYMPKPGSTIDLGKALRDAFKTGVKWIEKQGVEAYCIQSYNPVSESPDKKYHCITLEYEENENIPYVHAGDRVFIQIRRKEE